MRKKKEQSVSAKPSGIPEGETVWVSYYGMDGKKCFMMTSGPYREMYFLYAVAPDGAVKKIAESDSPLKLEDKYRILERISGENKQIIF